MTRSHGFFQFFENTNVSLLFFRKSALKKNMCFRKCADSDVTKGLIAGPLKSRTNQTWTKCETSCKEVVCVTSLCVCVFLSCACVLPSWRRSWRCARGRGRSSRNTPTKSCSRSLTDAPTSWSKLSTLWRTAADTHTQTTTHTHWEKRPLFTDTKHTKDVSPAVLTCVKQSV